MKYFLVIAAERAAKGDGGGKERVAVGGNEPGVVGKIPDKLWITNRYKGSKIENVYRLI